MRKLLIPAILSLLFFASCSTVEDTLEGSFDQSNEEEGGPSKILNSFDVGFNVVLEQGWGNIGIKGPVTIPPTEESAGNRDWFPYDYKPVEKPAGGFGFASGVELVRKGSKFDGATTGLTYLNVYGDFRYTYRFADKGLVFGGLGPYLGYGLGGTVKGASYSEAAFGGDDGYKRFDFGLHLKGGYEFSNSLRFALGYELGLFNKSPAPDFTSHNRTIALSVGYSLNKIIAAFRKK